MTTLRNRQSGVIATAIAWRWLLPMGVWYALGFSARWWSPFVRQQRQVIGVVLLILGAGMLVAGMMDSDSLQAALGTMMLVGGFLMLGTLTKVPKLPEVPEVLRA
jgi:hypothetical protein